ncbi:MAG TPA: CarD family transcriptional regulator [Anaerolineales bacterium]|nr:CarD family transcriptional regulator [Anaerolineales bacterium]
MTSNGHENGLDYSKGDWIVHQYHGVGQIKGIVKKKLNGKETRYYRVKTHDSTFFVPVKKADNQRIRPLTSRAKFKKALKILERPPEAMSSDHNTRRSRIRQAKSEGTVEYFLEIIRDLTARERDSKLNTTETRALRRFKNRVLYEWAACMDIDVEEAREQLEARLRPVVLAGNSPVSAD